MAGEEAGLTVANVRASLGDVGLVPTYITTPDISQYKTDISQYKTDISQYKTDNSQFSQQHPTIITIQNVQGLLLGVVQWRHVHPRWNQLSQKYHGAEVTDPEQHVVLAHVFHPEHLRDDGWLERVDGPTVGKRFQFDTL